MHITPEGYEEGVPNLWFKVGQSEGEVSAKKETIQDATVPVVGDL